MKTLYHVVTNIASRQRTLSTWLKMTIEIQPVVARVAMHSSATTNLKGPEAAVTHCVESINVDPLNCQQYIRVHTQYVPMVIMEQIVPTGVTALVAPSAVDPVMDSAQEGACQDGPVTIATKWRVT